MKKRVFGILIIMSVSFLITGCGNSNNNEKKEETVNCEEGYYLKDGKCTKVEDSKDAIISYNCEDGYTLDETNKNCTKIETKDAKIDNPCPTDYTFSNNKCTKSTTVDPTVTPSCLDGGTLSGSVCKYKDTKAAKATYTCPDGYYIVDSSNICYRGSHSSNCDPTNPFKIDGAQKINGVCVQTKATASPTTSYSCTTGFTLQGSTCVREYELNALMKKSCPSGYKASGDNCVKTETKDITGNYYCESGYDISDTICTKTTVKEALKSYSCEASYELLNNKCFKFESENSN